MTIGATATVEVATVGRTNAVLDEKRTGKIERELKIWRAHFLYSIKALATCNP